LRAILSSYISTRTCLNFPNLMDSSIHGPPRAALNSLSSDQVAFLCSLSKADLHAHLNGSIPISVLEQLAEEYTPPTATSLSKEKIQTDISQFGEGAAINKIDDFFQLFGAIYALTSTIPALKTATRAVLQEFLDGETPQCQYLELRTGPRKTESMSRKEYMLAVVEEVERYPEDRAGLILTLDRKTGEDIWEECLEIALDLKKVGRRLVGVDLAGDPCAGDVSAFESFFSQAKEAGLGVTLHAAEVRG
jgi:adenosine deaminase